VRRANSVKVSSRTKLLVKHPSRYRVRGRQAVASALLAPRFACDKEAQGEQRAEDLDGSTSSQNRP
jgi:hypothetical protein